MKGGGVVLEHKPLGLKTTSLINSFGAPFDFWMPEGACEVRVEAYSTVAGMIWRGILEDVVAKGGTLAAPQIVSPRMQLVPR